MLFLFFCSGEFRCWLCVELCVGLPKTSSANEAASEFRTVQWTFPYKGGFPSKGTFKGDFPCLTINLNSAVTQRTLESCSRFVFVTISFSFQSLRNRYYLPVLWWFWKIRMAYKSVQIELFDSTILIFLSKLSPAGAFNF